MATLETRKQVTQTLTEEGEKLPFCLPCLMNRYEEN